MKLLLILFLGVMTTIGCHHQINNDNPDNSIHAIRELALTSFKDLYRESMNSDSLYLDSAKLLKELVIYPGAFRLKNYHFDEAFHYSPFVVTISSPDNTLLAYFTFTDELFYLYNENTARLNPATNSVEFDSLPYQSRFVEPRYRNIEKNLNNLIITLGYQDSPQNISVLLEALFIDLLKMKRADYCELSELDAQLAASNCTKPECESCKAEVKKLLDATSSSIVQAKEGFYGYWKFGILEIDGKYKVDAHFYGDLIFQSLYF